MKMREDLRQLNTKGEVPSGTSPFAYVRMHGGGSPHLAVREQGGDPQQHDRPDDGRHEAAQRAHGHQPDEREEPPAQHAADEPHNQIDQQPRAAALDDEVRDPSGRQPQKQIPNEIHSLPFCGYGAAAAKSVPERQSAFVGIIAERGKTIRDARVPDEAGEGLPAPPYFRRVRSDFRRARSERLPQGPGQLVGARSAAAAAVDPFEAGDGLFDLHAAHQCSDALRVAVAAAREADAADDVVVEFDVDLSGAGPDAGMGQMSCHVRFC